MGFNIYILDGKKYYENPENEVYRGTNTGASEFCRQSPTFAKLCGFLGQKSRVTLRPEQYAPLIPDFSEERERTDKKRKRVIRRKLGSTSIDESRLGVILGGPCLLYENLDRCYQGLSRAKERMKRIELEM